jgi:hypothetical protein
LAELFDSGVRPMLEHFVFFSLKLKARSWREDEVEKNDWLQTSSVWWDCGDLNLKLTPTPSFYQYEHNKRPRK